MMALFRKTVMLFQANINSRMPRELIPTTGFYPLQIMDGWIKGSEVLQLQG
jgi:hypothetical protein